MLAFGLITGLAFGLGKEPEGLPVQEQSPGLSETATTSQPCPGRTSEEQFLPRELQESVSSQPAAAQGLAFTQDSAGEGTHTKERC